MYTTTRSMERFSTANTETKPTYRRRPLHIPAVCGRIVIVGHPQHPARGVHYLIHYADLGPSNPQRQLRGSRVPVHQPHIDALNVARWGYGQALSELGAALGGGGGFEAEFESAVQWPAVDAVSSHGAWHLLSHKLDSSHDTRAHLFWHRTPGPVGHAYRERRQRSRV